MSEAERASKAWLNMLGTCPRQGRAVAQRRGARRKAAEYRWYTLADGRQVYRPAIQHNDKRSDHPAPQIAPDYQMYTCPITERPVEGRVAHRENLKQHNCRILEPGETRDWKRNHKKERDEKLRRDVRECTLEAAREYGKL